MKIFNNRNEYREYPAINYSSLKAMASNPRALIDPPEISGEGVKFGEAVDTLRFDGISEYRKHFGFDSHENKPTSSSLILADAYIENYKGGEIVNPDVALALTKELKLWNKYKDATKLKQFDNIDFWTYIMSVINNAGKYVFTKELFNGVFDCVDTLGSHFLTEKYFDETQDNIELFDQLAFSFIYDELKEPVECKAMLDLVRIDHVEMTVEPVDLKTTADSGEKGAFRKALLRYRYDLQGKLYSYGMERWVNENYPGYRLLPFKWIVVSRNKPTKPFVYDITNFDLWINRFNSCTTAPLSTLNELITQFVWHRDNQLFEYVPEMYERKSVNLG
jgi:hypothetical protein